MLAAMGKDGWVGDSRYVENEKAEVVGSVNGKGMVADVQAHGLVLKLFDLGRWCQAEERLLNRQSLAFGYEKTMSGKSWSISSTTSLAAGVTCNSFLRCR